MPTMHPSPLGTTPAAKALYVPTSVFPSLYSLFLSSPSPLSHPLSCLSGTFHRLTQSSSRASSRSITWALDLDETGGLHAGYKSHPDTKPVSLEVLKRDLHAIVATNSLSPGCTYSTPFSQPHNPEERTNIHCSSLSSTHPIVCEPSKDPTVKLASITAQVSLRNMPDQSLDAVCELLVQHLRVSFDALCSANRIKVMVEWEI
ncbi:hypothetical protein EI94DRAFT_1819379 [Lactarius quietus]|nr:hypothetical protein EI94DRAFT_1819379 [Lactarius quietus]